MKTIRVIAFISFTFFCEYSTYSQQDLRALYNIIDTTMDDSLRAATYYNLAFASRLSDLNQAKTFSDSGYHIFERIGIEEGIHLKDYLDAAIMHAEGKYSEAIETNKRYLDWTINSKNQIRRTYAISSMAKYYRELGDLENAVEYTLEGIALQDSLDRSFDNGFYFAELGDLYTLMHQWEQAAEYIQKSYDHAVEMNYREGQSVSLRNMGTNALSQGNLEKAVDYVKQSLLIDSLDNREIGICRAKKDLAFLHEKMDKLADARKYYLSALKHINGTNNNYDFAVIYQGLARVSLASGALVQSKAYLDMADEYSSDIDRLEFHRDQEELRSKVLAASRDYRSAYLASRSFIEKQKQLLTDDISNQIAGLNIQFETQKKEQQIALLNAENEIANLALSDANSRLRIFTISLIAFGIISFILYRLLHRIRTQNKIISRSLQEKDVLLREIHHRVKNNLQVISSLLSLQARQVDDSGAQLALKEGKDRVRSMALIHQNLYQVENLTGIAIKEYFEELVESLFKSYNVAPDRIQLDLDIQELKLDIDTVIPIGLIVNELISNALKHAFPPPRTGVVSLRLKENQNHLILSVRDNGIGLDKTNSEDVKQSFGLRLIQTFQKKLGAELDIKNQEGTAVELKIRNYRRVA